MLKDLEPHESQYGLTMNDLNGTVEVCADCGTPLERFEYHLCADCEEDN